MPGAGRPCRGAGVGRPGEAAIGKPQPANELTLGVGHHPHDVVGGELEWKVAHRRGAGPGGHRSVDTGNLATDDVSSYSVDGKEVMSTGENEQIPVTNTRGSAD